MPLRVGALAFIGVFLITFIGLFSFPSQSAVIPFAFALLGIAMFILGTILGANYRGSAAAFAELWTVVGGRSFLRVFIRVFGTGLMIGGALFVALSMLAIFART